jgi:hypothetical protein
MLLTAAVILIILWALGLLGHIGGAFINILIVIALISIIMHFLRGSRSNV